MLREKRAERDTLLSESEEILLTSLRQPGLNAWGDLYRNLCGTMKCEMEFDGIKQSLGLGQTYSFLFGADEQKRKAAYEALTTAWKIHQEPAAAILNALAQFRLEVCKKRSHTKKVDFLTGPLEKNRIVRKTLEAMMTACEQNAPAIQKAVTAMAKYQNRKQLHPWDLNAPVPSKNKVAPIPFAEAIKTIRDAFSEINPEFGDFVMMMDKNNWIEARVLPNKSQGAYCTGFLKSRTPRVFKPIPGRSRM